MLKYWWEGAGHFYI